MSNGDNLNHLLCSVVYCNLPGGEPGVNKATLHFSVGQLAGFTPGPGQGQFV